MAEAVLDANVLAASDPVDVEFEGACSASSKTTSAAVAAAIDAAAGATLSWAAGDTALGASSDAAGDEAGVDNGARPGRTSCEGDQGGECQ